MDDAELERLDGIYQEASCHSLELHDLTEEQSAALESVLAEHSAAFSDNATAF
jgi:hypothetical protein